MSLTGKSVTSYRKRDLLNQKTPAVGFKVLRFAHQADAGDSGFNLNDLIVPPAMSSLGFSQPSPDELQSANLQFYKKNLVLVSSARGVLTEALDFLVGGAGQINFTDQFGTALQDEIFVGTIDPVVRTGNLLADTVFILETGELAANTTDIPVGRSFKTNTNPNMQIGAVQVLINGQMFLRNVGNATAAPSADGDYEEVDNGSGACNLIRLNDSDISARPYIVISTHLSVVNPDGSLLEDLQKQQATIDKIVETLAVVAGVPESNFQGAPTQPLLKQFGDRVVALERIGEKISGSSVASSTAMTTSFQTLSTISLTPGVWQLYYEATAGYTTGGAGGNNGYTVTRIADSGGVTLIGSSDRRIFAVNVSAAAFKSESSMRATEIIDISSTTSYTFQAKKVDSSGTGSGTVTNGTDGGSIFIAIRIA